jgi:PfaD family protein
MPETMEKNAGVNDPFSAPELLRVVRCPRSTAYVVRRAEDAALGAALAPCAPTAGEHTGTLPPLYPEWLGDRSFTAAHGTRFPYVAGEMAHGISGVDFVQTLARADILAFFGAAGLSPDTVTAAVARLRRSLPPPAPWGVNLIHSPHSPAWENELARLLITQNVPCVSLSAFIQVTRAAVHCSAAGLRLRPDGTVHRPRRVMAKISRPEIAAHFLAPAPAALLRDLVSTGDLSESEARLAARVPLADDVTVESDSGGHTDGRPLGTSLPQIMALRDTLARRHGITAPARVGAAGGMGTPHSVAAAFALGAAYVLTGSVNQLSTEAGTSDRARSLLLAADTMDTAMTASADMFELGAQVQVLTRGTMFAGRAARLRQLYRDHASLDDLPVDERQRLESNVFLMPIDQVWLLTEQFWSQRDPEQLHRAQRDPKHRMALVFRWYLGMSSLWALRGAPDRVADYQIWCGPAVGAFNIWRTDGYLASDHLSAVQIARNLMEGATVLTRAHQLRSHGVTLPASAFTFQARELL